jgi:hypothetical protein
MRLLRFDRLALCACFCGIAAGVLIGCGSGGAGDEGTGGTSGAGKGGTSGESGSSGAAGTAGEAGTSGGAGTSGMAGAGGTAGTTGSAGRGGAGGSSGSGGMGGSAGAGGRGGNAGAGGRGGGAGAAGRGGSSGATGAGGRGGSSGTTGVGGASGTGGGAATTCKRGIAANTAPSAAFYPAVRWWYNWGLSKTGGNTGIEFVPMIWGSSTVNGTIPAGSKYLLGFNEPNFKAQSNLTPQAAATAWPALQANARNAGALIVGPALNFCGPAANCNGTDPYVYLTDFLGACASCQVDHIAVHWYDDFPSLRAYIESNASLAGWEQFGKPIWLTEFSLNGNATAAQQEAFMRQAIPYLEGHPSVFRYSWFSADPIPNAKLINADGSPTALGQVYISLASNCQ